jgi:Tfp pilus assembly protein PilE
MRKLNQKGLTIVELLIATSIGAMVSFAIFSIHSFMMRSQFSSMNNMDVAELRYEAASTLAKEAKCTAILAGKASVAGTAIDISPAIKSNVTWGRLKIANVRLQSVRSLGSAGKTNAKLQIRGTRIGQGMARSDFDEYLNIYYTVNGSNTITTCDDDSSVCASMGGVFVSNHCDFCASLGGALRANGTCAPTL